MLSVVNIFKLKVLQTNQQEKEKFIFFHSYKHTEENIYNQSYKSKKKYNKQKQMVSKEKLNLL